MKITLQSSFKLFLFFLTIHLIAVLSLIVSGAELWLKIVGILVCVVSLFYVLRHYVWLKSGRSIQQIILDQDQQWWVVQKNDDAVQVCLLGDTLVTPFLVILNFKKFSLLPEGRVISLIKQLIKRNQISLLVCSDSVKVADDFRKLCVCLRTA